MSRGARAGLGLAAGLLLLGPGVARAQIVSPAPAPAAAAPGPLSRYGFHLSVLRSAPADLLYRWDADIGGDLDLVDYGAGRLTFLANYETIVGNQRRNVDPVQGNYLLDLSASWRAGGVELFGVLHHVSRHLSDREKPRPVDWNMVGGRALGRIRRRGAALVVSAHALWTVQRSFVDYAREIGGHVAFARELSPRRAFLLRGSIAVLDVVAGASRGAQLDVRAESGLRLAGGVAAAEIVGAVERRADALTLAPGPRAAVLAGVRFVRP